MIRPLLASALAALLAGPVQAWTFTETDICRLTHAEDALAVDLSFDPAAGIYTITLTRPGMAWPDAPVFSLRFDGPRALQISTDRHVTGDEGRSLTVTDTGFGNVLDGIEFNTRMTALIGDQAISLSTDTAAPAMQAFRACPQPTTS